jgi:uncharacterized protein YndB with AHSA1/START domain
MNYRLELILDRPRAEVWKIFDDPDNMNKWQPSLVKLERVSGTAGRPGSVTALTFKNGDREFSLTEEVTFRAEPERLDGFYENVFAKNFVHNTFLEHDKDHTLWKVEAEFQFKTWFMRVISPFVKKRFVASTQRDMERFKALVERTHT